MRFFAHSVLVMILFIGVLVSAHIAPVPVQAQAPAMHTILEHTIGFSVQGRPITALQIGNGWRKLVVVGDTHGGPESNTYWLTLELMDHFRANPHQVPSDIRLYLIPTLNPDGLELWSRYNANGVDLNRNMNTNLDVCPDNDWSTTVYGAGGIVSYTGGPYPDSEVESQIIRNFLLDASGDIFLHSNAGLVFPAYCEHQPSIHIAQAYAEASGYVYSRYWPNYMINGGMHDWAASVGVASIIPELVTATSTEFAQNLAGVQAVMAQPPDVLPPPQDHTVGQFVVLAPIWRYWMAHGGEQVFGLPIESPQPTANGFIQTFTNVRLEMRYSLADTPLLVQTAPLGVENLQRDGYTMPGAAPKTPPPPAQAEPTGTYQGSGGAALAYIAPPDEMVSAVAHNLPDSSPYFAYWQRYGGVEVFGAPINEEFTVVSADGQQRVVQYFERAALSYNPEDGNVRLEPLGWQTLMFEQVQEPWVAPQIR